MKHAKEIRLTDEELARARVRLAAESELVGDCVEFRGGTDASGYRDVHFKRDDSRHFYVHRLAYAAYHGGYLPAEKVVMHVCDNRVCIRATHLRLGTAAENSEDMTNKGRRARRWSEADYERVRQLREDGLSYPQIAKATGVSQSQAYRIINGGR